MAYVPKKSSERLSAEQSYTQWVAWKRQELGRLIQQYRTEFPKQIAAYETSAMGALPEAQKNMWGGMYTNLNQRGLSDSASFLGGAKNDLANWTAQQKSSIEDTKQGMDASAQRAILSALGQPDYGGLYKNWVDIDNQIAAFNAREEERNGKGQFTVLTPENSNQWPFPEKPTYPTYPYNPEDWSDPGGTSGGG